MAISLPTARVAIRPSATYRRTTPICSGDAAGDLTYGWRGLVREQNHCYAYRVHTIAHACPLDADTVAISTTVLNPGYATLTGEIAVPLGADVAAIEALFDCENADCRLDTDEGNSAVVQQIARGVATCTYALADTSGATRLVHLHYRSTDGADAYVYRWLIREVILVAGDIP